MTLITNMQSDDGHTASESRQWDRINAAAICGKAIQYDNSGVGHNWRTINAAGEFADIREEIAAEILDGGRDTCDDYIASNGCHYRW